MKCYSKAKGLSWLGQENFDEVPVFGGEMPKGLQLAVFGLWFTVSKCYHKKFQNRQLQTVNRQLSTANC
jgi:hypothetical protein